VKVGTEDNESDVFTKQFGQQDFELKRWHLGLRDDDDEDTVGQHLVNVVTTAEAREPRCTLCGQRVQCSICAGQSGGPSGSNVGQPTTQPMPGSAEQRSQAVRGEASAAASGYGSHQHYMAQNMHFDTPVPGHQRARAAGDEGLIRPGRMQSHATVRQCDYLRTLLLRQGLTQEEVQIRVDAVSTSKAAASHAIARVLAGLNM
jgi:hypothetical protein